MNPYLAKFFTLDIGKHLENIADIPFDVGAGFFTNFFLTIFGIIILTVVFIIPLIAVRIVEDTEKKHQKFALLIDIVMILVVALLMMNVTYMYSGIRQGISSEGAFYGTTFRGLVNYRQYIGRLSAVIYSILINHRLFNKYLVKLKIDKYKKVIFSAIFIVWLFISYYFWYLCQFLSGL